jgi:hypothetical protein
MKLHLIYRAPETGGDEGGSDGGVSTAPAAAPAPAASAPAAAPASAPASAPAAAPAASPAAGPAPASAPAADDGKKATEGYWPTDWRETVSKEDAKVLTRLQRYASPEAALSALIAAQNRIAAGELKPVLGKNPTPEQVAEYRTALGIPETADKYDLGKDVQISDAERPLMDKLFSAAHGTHQTPDQVKATLKVWRELQQTVAEDRLQRDETIKAASEDQLRAEWGPEFRRNLNLINGLLDGAGSPEVVGSLLESRLPNGTRFGDSPEVMKLLVGLALVQNPTGIVVPGGEGDLGKGIKEELDKISETRRTKREEYNKNEKLQQRERELIAAAIKSGLMTEGGEWKK